MDLNYIFFNGLVYSTCAFLLGIYFGYLKFLNFMLGSYIVLISYMVYNIHYQKLSMIYLVIFFLFYVFVNYIIISFKNIKQRELFGFVFTIGGAIFLENIVNYVWGANSVNINNFNITTTFLVFFFIFLFVIIFYILKYSFLGKILYGLQENENILMGLGYKLNNIYFWLSIVSFLMIIFISYIILIYGNIRSSDGIFYIIKSIGIMILVGVSNIKLMFLGGLIYVIFEYIIFIKLNFPIAYKETIVLLIILIILIFKPNGIFSFINQRRV